MRKFFYITLYGSLFVALSSAVFLPIFRCTWYWKMAVAPSDPYGGGDIVELLLYFLLIGGSTMGSLQAVGIILAEKKQRKFGVCVLIVAFLAVIIGTLASRWAWLNCVP